VKTTSELVLLDTSVWVDAFKGKSHHIVSITRTLLNEDRVATCGPVLLEIRRGLRSREKTRILGLLDALVRLRFDEDLWDKAGDLDSALRKKGITLPPMDILIGQICLHHRVPLFTLHEHFKSIPGLKLFSPLGTFGT